jgi:hypothetical protein
METACDPRLVEIHNLLRAVEHQIRILTPEAQFVA